MNLNIGRILYNFINDVKVGGRFLGGEVKTNQHDEGAKNISNSQYYMLEDVFSRITISPKEILVDVGCGKGRVLNFWISKYKNNKVIGVEIDNKTADFTKNRLKKYANCNVINSSILDYECNGDTLFYLFNPFDDRIMKKFKTKLEEISSDICVRILYLIPACIQMFENDEKWQITELPVNKKTYRCVLLERK